MPPASRLIGVRPTTSWITSSKPVLSSVSRFNSTCASSQSTSTSTSSSAPIASTSTQLPSQPSSSRAKAQARINHIDSSSPAIVSPFLTDSFGRKHDYLRISLTEKCNLRCTYCMPEAGVKLLPRDDLLTTDEIERTARIFVANGVTKIRLTGGEPTVRKDLIDVVTRLGRLSLSSLGMTSNGISLKRKLPQLVDAGLTHLNLSLDTLDPFKYELMTRRRGYQAVMESLEVARSLKSSGLRTKINVVVIRGLNDDEVPQFVELTKHMDITVRFIEYMPFEDNRWSTSKLVPSADLVSRLKTIHPDLEKMLDPHSDTTRTWRVPGYRGKVGFISSMSDHFCGECSRLRIGADGGVKVRLASTSARSNTLADHRAIVDQEVSYSGLSYPISGLLLTSGLCIIANTSRINIERSRQPLAVPLHFLGSTSIRTGARLFSSSARRMTQGHDNSPSSLTHIDPKTGKASMVSVSSKAITLRSATAIGRIRLNSQAWSLIDFDGSTSSSTESSSSATMRTKKGDVLTIAHLAGLIGTKHTSLLIPLCHPLLLSNISLSLRPIEETRSIEVRCTVECEGKTGVEMEALTGVNVALLTVWDMCKAVAGKEMVIEGIKVVEKSGGRSGDWTRSDVE